MARFVGLDVSQKLTSICVVDDAGRRLWRGQCHSEPEPIERAVRRHAGDDASIGIETGPMTPWLVHELRGRGLNVVCLDARHASAALKMQMNKTDQNDAEGLAQIMRTGWYRSVHVKSLDAHRTRALLGARAQLVGMTTRLSNHIRGVLKTLPFAAPPQSTIGLPASAGGSPSNNSHAGYWRVASAPALLRCEARCFFRHASGTGRSTSLAPCTSRRYGSEHRIADRIAPAAA
jgi:transposase